MMTWWIIEIIIILSVFNSFNFIMECDVTTLMTQVHALSNKMYVPKLWNKYDPSMFQKSVIVSEMYNQKRPLIEKSVASQLNEFYRQLQGHDDISFIPNSSFQRDVEKKKLDDDLNIALGTLFRKILALDYTTLKSQIHQWEFYLISIIYSAFIAALGALISSLSNQKASRSKQFTHRKSHVNNVEMLEVIDVLCKMLAQQPTSFEGILTFKSALKVQVKTDKTTIANRIRCKFLHFLSTFAEVPFWKSKFLFLERCVSSVYILFQSHELMRLASFQPLVALQSSIRVSFSTLANAGFKYTGREREAVCEGCGRREIIENFNSHPCEPKYHRQNCQFSITIEERSSRNGSETIEADGCPLSPSEIPTPRLAHNQHISGPSNFIDNSHVLVSNNDVNAIPSHDINNHPSTIIQHLKSATSSVPKRTYSVSQDSMTVQTSESNSSDQTERSSVGDGSISSTDVGATNEASAPEDSKYYLSDIYTTPEQSFGNDGKPLTSISCEKNPKHANFIPLQERPALSRFPKKLRDERFIEVMLLMGCLTVKIEVYGTSAKRPTDDPARKTEVKPRVGTGSLLQKSYQIVVNKEYYELAIETNRHVIFDDEEARSSAVYFFTGGGQIWSKQNGNRIEHSAVPGDYTSYLICRTSDLGLVERLNKFQREFRKKVQALPRSVKMYLTEKIAVIGLPHGTELTVSFGKSTVLHVILVSDGRKLNVSKINNYEQVVSKKEWVRKMLTHIADTCPGLSGAPILRFNMYPCGDDIRFDLDVWMHDGVLRDDVFNVSVMKECGEEELHSWGISKVSRAHQDIIPPATNTVCNGGTLRKQPLPAVDSVGSYRSARAPPAYPIYVSFQKRLESFTNWIAHHIATPNDLSSSGFFYAGYADCVRCFQCGLGLKSWKPGDNIDVEHERHRPTCPFLQELLNTRAVNRSLLADSEIMHQPRTSEIYTLPLCQAPRGQSLTTPLDGMSKLRSIQPPQFQVYYVSATQSPRHNDSMTEEITNLDWNERSSVGDSLSVAITTQNTEDSQAPSLNGERNSQIVSEGNMTRDQTVADNVASVTAIAHQPTGPETEEELTLRLLQNENKGLNKLMMCKVCQKAPIRELLLPCGELYACSECSTQLSHCPVCNRLILATVTTFFA